MSWIELIILAIALSLDSLVVSIASGTTVDHKKLMHHAIIMSIAFGISHSIALIIGWYTGEKFIAQISELDHWIAFGLLCIIGVKMIWESVSHKEKSISCPIKKLPILCLATSIDALGVGLSLALIQEPILHASVIIGGIVLIISLIGVLAGRQLSKYFGHYAELIGGVILIAIGVKILIEHL